MRYTRKKLILGNDKLIMISAPGPSRKGRCERMLTMKIKAAAIEPPIDDPKSMTRAIFGTSTAASGLSEASPLGLSGSLSGSLEGMAIG